MVIPQAPSIAPASSSTGRATGSTNPAIRYERVTFSYAASREPESPQARNGPALQNITFDIRRGERLGILGPNGGGKSTLLKLTLGLLTGNDGRIEVMGRSPEQARREHLIGYVPQRVEAELACPLSVRQVVTLAATRELSPWKRTPPATRELVARMLEVVGATELTERPIGKLSGGQLQRVMIARALALQPSILLLDEPTVGIDVTGQRRFAEMLASLRERLELTIVIVSHDIRAIAAGCDRVACLSRTLHFHDAPQGLSPAVLAEVFRHDLSGIFGDLHVDAHRADQCGHSHPHPHPSEGPGGPAHESPVVSLGISAASKPKGGMNP